jgi:HPt (histidine-containing phosphotransfer) domain-containing protein
MTTTSHSKPTTSPVIKSQLANDPEMAELVDLFVGELPKRVESVMQAWRARELESLKRLAHQLKGSCAGYGFPSLGQAAAKVENRILSPSPEEQKLAALGAEVNELIELCKRATGGPSAKKAA